MTGPTARRPAGRPRRAATLAGGRLAARAAMAGLAGAVCTACAAAPGALEPGDAGSVQVVASIYPLGYVAGQVGAGDATVAGLTPPGADAHDLEPTPSQVAQIARADLVVHLAGFQPVIDDVIRTHATGTTVDASALVPLLDPAGEPATEHDHGGAGGDPHFWLDPERLASIAGELARTLSGLDPEHATGYAARADDLGERLAALDAEYADGLADCQRREIVVGHASFGYLADRYRLRQIAVTGLAPEAEPGPRRLGEVIGEAREHGATTIFHETSASPAVAQIIADQVGATTAVLHPIESRPSGGGDYLSLMRENLRTLRAGLGCA